MGSLYHNKQCDWWSPVVSQRGCITRLKLKPMWLRCGVRNKAVQKSVSCEKITQHQGKYKGWFDRSHLMKNQVCNVGVTALVKKPMFARKGSPGLLAPFKITGVEGMLWWWNQEMCGACLRLNVLGAF